MKPNITATGFGWIDIGGERYEHDIIIRLDGRVKKRKKKLSKAVYGTSHTVSRDEARYVYEDGASRIIVGSGQNGVLDLSKEARRFFKKRGCLVELLTTPDAIIKWNASKGAVIGLFHITC
ncbi:MAG: hypothetical protein JSV33_10860 [bacterium]|nr:MAG: hypothetical protein JSV33_10860 [bacterium]